MSKVALTTTVALAALMSAPVAAQDVSALPAGTNASTGEADGNTVAPHYGNIDAFYGNIDAFYGDIDAFWDDINPFYGDIDAFWDDINPFYGDIDAFWGDIDAFYGDIDAFSAADLSALGDFGKQTSGQISTIEGLFKSISYNTDGSIVRDGTPNKVMAALNVLIEQGRTQFGQKIEAETGKTYDQWVDELFARHGANRSSRASIEVLTEAQRVKLYLDWHDSLMSHAGIDHIDHWMSAINWSPSITQIQGKGDNTIIGIIDADLSRSSGIADNVVQASGESSFVSGHGAGVASLIVGEHDGEGVMGIAPNAKLVAHNPFDETNTANWTDIQSGIDKLVRADASIINMSLGEPGTVFAQDWRGVFSDLTIAAHKGSTAYVLAAGNDGIAQQGNIDWTGAGGTSFILVGSVSPNGTISKFSNRPGDACLLTNGVCGQGDRLMDRFIVAPGEFLLVDDGMGGITRRSGTSFAAPLVSGAIALLHERWPWLANHADASTEIILRSARDLGAPGTDAVYGVGMLDVMASQSPLDFNQMSFKFYQRKLWGYKSYWVSASSLLGGGIPNWWEYDDVFLTMFEDVGGTYRDFAVPMSSYTYGKRTNALGGGYLRMQDFVADRFSRWILSNGTDTDGDGVAGIRQLQNGMNRKAGEWNVQYSAIAPRLTDEGVVRPVHNSATLTDPSGTFAFTGGHGHGALVLGGGAFGIVSDHDRDTGGANPFLGLASGEAFGALAVALTPATTVRVGFTENRLDAEERAAGDPLARMIRPQFDDLRASAVTLDLEQRVSDRVNVGVHYTRLSEANGLLGMQASNVMLGMGSDTEALTVSGAVQLSPTLRLDVSATGATSELSEGQLLHNDGRVVSTAAQIAMTGSQVFSQDDTLRVSFGQPMTVEQGTLALESEAVIDRSTGERGQVTQHIGISSKRRMTGEVVYATSLRPNAQLGLFGRFVTKGSRQDTDAVMAGVNFDFRF